MDTKRTPEGEGLLTGDCQPLSNKKLTQLLHINVSNIEMIHLEVKKNFALCTNLQYALCDAA